MHSLVTFPHITISLILILLRGAHLAALHFHTKKDFRPYTLGSGLFTVVFEVIRLQQHKGLCLCSFIYGAQTRSDRPSPKETLRAAALGLEGDASWQHKVTPPTGDAGVWLPNQGTTRFVSMCTHLLRYLLEKATHCGHSSHQREPSHHGC